MPTGRATPATTAVPTSTPSRAGLPSGSVFGMSAVQLAKAIRDAKARRSKPGFFRRLLSSAGSDVVDIVTGLPHAATFVAGWWRSVTGAKQMVPFDAGDQIVRQLGKVSARLDKIRDELRPLSGGTVRSVVAKPPLQRIARALERISPPLAEEDSGSSAGE